MQAFCVFVGRIYHQASSHIVQLFPLSAGNIMICLPEDFCYPRVCLGVTLTVEGEQIIILPLCTGNSCFLFFFIPISFNMTSEGNITCEVTLQKIILHLNALTEVTSKGYNIREGINTGKHY